MPRFLLLISLFVIPCLGFSQARSFLSGRVVDESDVPVPGATIQFINGIRTFTTDSLGRFRIAVTGGRPFGMVFSLIGYATVQKNFLVGIGKEEKTIVKLKPSLAVLDPVTVKDDRYRREVGMVSIDANKALLNPSPLGNIESLIKVFVGSNNELTSQYSVRGGSYDENLIYVNDFEVFRPYLVKSGQQEGLSFINPELTGGVKFYNGGFPAKYGDKLSSVLDITYRKPKASGGSAYIGLLEQGLHLEGASRRNKFTYLLGARNRSNRNLLNSQSTKGNYIPSSYDFQSLLTWQATNRWLLELLTNYSSSRFTLFPQSSQLTSSVFTSLYSQNLGLDIYFSGREKDRYSTGFNGFSATYQPNKRTKLKWLASHFSDKEAENLDITGVYLFGERDYNKDNATFGQITDPQGAGAYQNFSRNQLAINVYDIGHKGTWEQGKHSVSWGASLSHQTISDNLNEWQYNDSAGYSLPFRSGKLPLFYASKGKADLTVDRLSGYLQDNIQTKGKAGAIFQIGARYNYNTLNNEFLVSPRLGVSLKPKAWQKDVVLKAALGMYQQPPFYREMRRYDGSVNTGLKAQKSLQGSMGADINFKMLGRPARFTTEGYWKWQWDVVPFDVDNVRTRYWGENRAKAYAVGIENRLYGELVKDAESWVSIGIMQTKEKIDNFNYYRYLNAAGQTIGSGVKDRAVADSALTSVGWVRRPTDRLVTFGLFFQDYMSNNKNLKFYLNSIYGTNLPYNIPNSVKYRNALTIPSYIRIDMGFSALLIDGEKNKLRSHSPFRNFQSIWASFEVFNIIDHSNTISYLLIKDYQNNTYTIPNRLTPRLLNLKVVARW